MASLRRRLFAGLGVTVILCGVALAQPSRRPRGARCEAPSITVRKGLGVLELWCSGARRYSFPATFGANPLGPKVREGDERTPEGEYRISSRVVNTRFHRFLGVSYPNEADRRRAAALGVTRLGGGIGIHGTRARYAGLARLWIRASQGSSVWGPTDGCIALTNEDVETVYDLVPVGARVVITP